MTIGMKNENFCLAFKLHKLQRNCCCFFTPHSRFGKSQLFLASWATMQQKSCHILFSIQNLPFRTFFNEDLFNFTICSLTLKCFFKKRHLGKKLLDWWKSNDGILSISSQWILLRCKNTNHWKRLKKLLYPEVIRGCMHAGGQFMLNHVGVQNLINSWSSGAYMNT